MRRDRNRMSPRLRRSIYGLTALLFGSGMLWFLLDRFAQIEGPFGPGKHPWQHPLLVIHGVVATAYLLFLGNVLARHVQRGWNIRSQRLQGATLLLSQVLLVLTAPALYYVGQEGLRGIFSNLHLLAGLLMGLALPAHLWIGSLLAARKPLAKPRATVP